MKPLLWLKAAGIAILMVGYPILMHVLLTSEQWPATTLFVGLLPLALLPMGLLKSGQIVAGLLASVAMLVAIAVFWSRLLSQQEWLYLIQNIAMQGLMAWVFGRTLRAPHEALITQLARRLHRNDFTPAIARYTRAATWAWVGFFVAMTLISMLLFAVASLEAWSFFVNVLYLPLLGLMFLLEYAARRYCLRGVNHLSIVKGVAVYWEKPAAPVDKKI